MQQSEFIKTNEIIRKYGVEAINKLSNSKEYQKEYSEVIKEKNKVFKQVQETYNFTNDKMKELYNNYSTIDIYHASDYMKNRQGASNVSGLFLTALKSGYGKKIIAIPESRVVATQQYLTDKIVKEEREISDMFTILQNTYFNIPEQFRDEVTEEAKTRLELQGIAKKWQLKQVIMRKAVDIYEQRVKETLGEVEEEKGDRK